MKSSPPAGSGDPPVEVSIEEMLATRLSLSSVIVKGAARTSPKLLDRLTQPVISTGGTFASVVEDVSNAVDRLRSTNCFRGVDAFIDTGPDNSSKAVFTLVEKSLFQLHTGTMVDTSAGARRDPSVQASFNWRNLSGQADSLKAAASWMGGAAGEAIAARPTSKFTLDYHRPFALDLRAGLSVALSSAMHNHEQNSSHSLMLRTLQTAIDHPLGKLALVADWRDVQHVDDKASPLVHADAGHSWKTSLQHILEVDRRDSRRMPSSGDFFSLTTETTLPIGDIRYAKVDAAHQLHIPLGSSGISASLSTKFGVLLSNERTNIIDRFYLGGPTSFRGFQTRGVGPRDENDAVGGDIYYSLAGMLSFPMPESSLLSQLFNAHMHIFGSVGELTDVPSAKETASAWKGKTTFKEKASSVWSAIHEPMRISTGLGIALETAIGRIEVNYCRVLRSAATDAASSGIQFGISESFL